MTAAAELQSALCAVPVIAIATLREALRQRMLAALLIGSLGFILATHAVRDLNFGGGDDQFILDAGAAVLSLCGAVLVVLATVQSFFGEIEQRTAHALLARPVPRGAFMVGKALGISALAALFCGGAALPMALMMQANGEGIPWMRLATFSVSHWLVLSVLGGMTLLLASFGRSALLTALLALMLAIVCHLRPVLDEYAESARAGTGKVLAATAGIALPDFQHLDLAMDADAAGVEWTRVGLAFGYGATYWVAFLGLAAYAFHQREF